MGLTRELPRFLSVNVKGLMRTPSVRTNAIENVMRHLLHDLGDSRKLTFRSSEVNHISVFLEHVDLLNRLNGLHVELLQGSLQLLVVSARGLVHFLLFSSWCSFASKSRKHQLLDLAKTPLFATMN